MIRWVDMDGGSSRFLLHQLAREGGRACHWHYLDRIFINVNHHSFINFNCRLSRLNGRRREANFARFCSCCLAFHFNEFALLFYLFFLPVFRKILFTLKLSLMVVNYSKMSFYIVFSVIFHYIYSTWWLTPGKTR